MRESYLLIVYFLGVIPLFAQSAQTTTTLNLRVQPSSTAAIKTVLPKGTEVEVVLCDDQWCRVSYQQVAGYVSKNYLQFRELSLDTDPDVKSTPLTLDHNPPTSPIRHYTNTQGEQVQSPTGYKKAPEGASALCRDGTYSFSQNRRGTCSHHGGVAQWLK